MPDGFIRCLGWVKAACASANEDLGRLSPEKAALIRQAVEVVSRGELAEHFPLDVFQTGSGTSTNMNANEVIANWASQVEGKPIGSKDPLAS